MVVRHWEVVKVKWFKKLWGGSYKVFAWTILRKINKRWRNLKESDLRKNNKPRKNVIKKGNNMRRNKKKMIEEKTASFDRKTE